MAAAAMSWGVRTIEAYQKMEQVGEGTYGHVFKGIEKKTGEQVALKRLIFHTPKEPAGMPQYAIREIKALKQLAHKNIVKLKDVVVSFDEEDNTKEDDDELRRCGQLFLVFEYVDHDLAGLLDNRYEFTPQAIKTIMKQLFEVLDFLHSKQCIHRDIKCSNLLLSNNYVLKLADFGLSRSLDIGYDDSFLRPGQRRTVPKMTYNVITLWYRPPELLLGSRDYDYAVDLWSAGCILGELLARRPLFPAKTEVQQLDTIFQRVGTPTKSSWPEHDSLPNPYNYSFQPVYQQDIASLFPNPIPQSALDLVQRLLTPDPKMRYTSQKALEHRYFVEDPRAPNSPEELGTLDLTPGTSLHEYQTKKAKRAAKAAAQGGQDAAGAGIQMGLDAQMSQASDTTVPSWFPPAPPSIGPPMPLSAHPVNRAAAVAAPAVPPPTYALYQEQSLPDPQSGYRTSQYTAHGSYPQRPHLAAAEANRVQQHAMYGQPPPAVVPATYQHVTVAPPIISGNFAHAPESAAYYSGSRNVDHRPQPQPRPQTEYFQDIGRSRPSGNGQYRRSRSKDFAPERPADRSRDDRNLRDQLGDFSRRQQSEDHYQPGRPNNDRFSDARSTYQPQDTRDSRDRRSIDRYRSSREENGFKRREAPSPPRYDSRDRSDRRYDSGAQSRSHTRGGSPGGRRQPRRSRSRSRSRSRGRSDSFSHRHSQTQRYETHRRPSHPRRSESRDRDRRRYSSSSRR